MPEIQLKKYLTAANFNRARQCLPLVAIAAGVVTLNPILAGLGGLGTAGNFAISTVQEVNTSRELTIQKNQLTIDLGIEAIQKQNERLLLENNNQRLEIEEYKKYSTERVVNGEVIQRDEHSVHVYPTNTVLNSYKTERDALATRVEELEAKLETAEAEALLVSCSVSSAPRDVLTSMAGADIPSNEDFEIKAPVNRAIKTDERRKTFLSLYPEFRLEDVIRELRLSTVGAKDLISTWIREAKVIPGHNGRYAITGR